MSQFNAFQPEQNSKRDLVEAWEIAEEENQRLRNRIAELLLERKEYKSKGQSK